MEQSILLRYGEIHLKGQNRPFFERKLLNNIKSALRAFDLSVIKTQGRFFVENYQAKDEKAIIEALKKVFGLHSISPARMCEKDWATISAMACEVMKEAVEANGGEASFKVVARRSDKTFPMNSNQMAPELGGIILEKVPGTRVDVKTPEIELGLEIREKAYCYAQIIKGADGMPVGCNGKVSLLLSGGIDSPVAGYMMMKRGLELDCVHFHSFPYTSERAREKVIDLAKILARYSGSIRMFILPITDFQMAVYEKCPPAQMTVLLRRGMMQAAERIALENGSQALVTGEAVGQVASQTLESLRCTNDAVDLPVFRPCIGFDKMEIVSYARKIDTYETSILPYEDCCTIFTPKHPVTKPKLEQIRKGQAMLPEWDELLEKAHQEKEILRIEP